MVLAGRKGFEPPEPFQVRRFSKPVHSTTLPPAREEWKLAGASPSESGRQELTLISFSSQKA